MVSDRLRIMRAYNCGLKVKVEKGRMVKVLPDRENPRSKGYACRKGLNILYHQYQENRITQPLKKVNGKFEPIYWDRGIGEISEKMKRIVGNFGPRSLAYMGGSSQGGHMEAGFGLSLLLGMGSKYYYSSAGQEFSGYWWVTGRVMGKQYNINGPDEHNTEMLVAWGWNGMESHQMPRAPLMLKQISKDPNKTLLAIDPRKSETAQIADIHLALRPGTDALLIKAMVAIILDNGWENKSYLDNHVEGWDQVLPWFKVFEVGKALQVCGLDYDMVLELCRLMTTKRWSFHQDLGIYLDRHSTLNSYFLHILGVVCGVFQTCGGTFIPGMVMPMGFHADERNPKVWKTMVTNMPPAAAGSFPPAVMPEEICSDHPERLRAVYFFACNPLRAYPDTKAYEKAFNHLDLLVVNDIVLTETACLADKTLGKEWDSAAKAAFWGILMTAPQQFREHAARAGFEPDLTQGDQIFQALLDTPQGLWVGNAGSEIGEIQVSNQVAKS